MSAPTATPPARLHLIVGKGTPVDIARELDTKVDDSVPTTGNLRSADSAAGPLGAGASSWGAGDASCVNGTGTGAFWDVNLDSQDCNTVYLF